MAIDHSLVPSPCYVLEEARLRENLNIISRVQKESGVEVILAFKGFAMWSAFPIVKEYVKGATASSLNEAKLCRDEMNTKSHTYSVAYLDNEFDEVVDLSSHITFNSIAQFEKYKSRAIGKASCGLRVNPEWSDVTTDLYNPASKSSRLGVTGDEMPEKLPEGIEGLHFHVLCESDSYALENVLVKFEKRLGKYLGQVKWVNMGGGHLMTKTGYDLNHLINLLRSFKERYGVDIILEPGSAFAWQVGDLVSTVLDVVENGGIKTAILDVSFTCHMPDTLEMPYRPDILGAQFDGSKGGLGYRLGGVSCLAGDYLSEYYFQSPLAVGDRIIFQDMIHYTMVKTTMFNGVNHPEIGIWNENGFKSIRQFDYSDFKSRLS